MTLSESAIFVSGPEGIPDPVTGGQITLKDDVGNEEILTEFEAGKYATAVDGMQGTIGRTYWIEIQLNEKIYQSKPEKMLPVVSAESLEFELSTEQRINPAGNFVDVNLITIFVNTRFPSQTEQSFLKWNSFGIYQFPDANPFNQKICYVAEDIDFDKVVVADSKKINNGFLQKQLIVTREIDFRFAFRYCFKVIQQSITKNTYEFWMAVGTEFERSGNIFETPPGKIEGNIFDVNDDKIDVLGMFSASAVDTIELLVLRDDAGSPRHICNDFSTDSDVLSRCDNCLVIPNSSIVKPLCFD